MCLILGSNEGGWIKLDKNIFSQTSHLFLDYSLEEYKKCVQAGFNVGANIYGVYVSGGVEGGSCDGLLNEMGGEGPSTFCRKFDYFF